MKKMILSVLVLMGALVTGAAFADQGTPDEAKAMVEKAITAIKADKEGAFAKINDAKDTEFHDRDLYVFVISTDDKGTFIAHGTKPALVGKDLIGLKDPDGVPLVKNFIELVNSKGEGWSDYKWPHPETKKNTPKSSYVKKVDGEDFLVGVGVYK